LVTGYNPSLNATINETLAKNGTLTEADFEQVYATYISPGRYTEKIDHVGAQVMDEINQNMAMVDAAVGLGFDLHRKPYQRFRQAWQGKDREGLRTIVESLVATASEMRPSNQALEERLSSSREEINQLQENLAVVRSESLTDPVTRCCGLSPCR
jgi:diguanylate cyclase